MNIIEKYSHEGKGYNPYLITPRWQVAQLNHATEEELESVDKLDIHFETDEAFFLIEGEAVLIAATIDNMKSEIPKINYDFQIMQPGILYNIPKKVWHNIALSPGAKVLIIEDANTHLGDYEFFYLSEIQQEELKKEVSLMLKAQREKLWK